MKVRGIAIGIVLLFNVAFGQIRPLEIQLSYGGWSLSPFQTIVEKECEDLIRNEFNKWTGSAIPDVFLSPFLSNLDISSSGQVFSLALSYRFGQSRFSAGVRGDYFVFRLPYFLSVEESLEIPGFRLVTVKGQGLGTVRLKGLAILLFGRWTPLQTRRLDLSLEAGLMRLPFQGRITLDQTIALQTHLGEFLYSGRYEQTIDEVRELGLDVPSSIVSPALGIELHYKLAAGAGIFINIRAGQGTVYSGGLFCAF